MGRQRQVAAGRSRPPAPPGTARAAAPSPRAGRGSRLGARPSAPARSLCPAGCCRAPAAGTASPLPSTGRPERQRRRHPWERAHPWGAAPARPRRGELPHPEPRPWGGMLGSSPAGTAAGRASRTPSVPPGRAEQGVLPAPRQRLEPPAASPGEPEGAQQRRCRDNTVSPLG